MANNPTQAPSELFLSDLEGDLNQIASLIEALQNCSTMLPVSTRSTSYDAADAVLECIKKSVDGVRQRYIAVHYPHEAKRAA